VRSIKVKFGGVILAAVAMTLVLNEVGLALDVKPVSRWALAAALSLLMVQLLARGMTSPLREMAAAARAMARGEYDRRVTATSRDEVGELARAFTSMATELAAVDAQRKRLVADVSHELRTPLAALQAVLENLADGVTPPDPATYETALAQTRRLGRLVDQLLDLSRLESGVVPLERRRVALAPLLEQAVREAAVTGRDVHLACEVAPPELTAEVDPERLHQVLANLLDNATRYSPPGGTVRVTAARLPTGLRLVVQDDGPGIDPVDRRRVFERFARVDPARPAAAAASAVHHALGGGPARRDRPRRARARRTRPGRTPRLPGCRVVVDLPDAPEHR
jgi:signal transduction histidine kinase